MPSPHRVLSGESAAEITAAAFAPPSAQRCGLEIEWPVFRAGDGLARPAPAELRAALDGPLPRGGRITVEPGGQIELSTLAAGTVDATLDAADADTTAVRARLRAAGLRPVDRAVDSLRPPRRVLEAPRYACMERFFRWRDQGDAGAWMMCNTASLQVNVSHHALDPDRRWSLAHRIGPLLIATFARSPGIDRHGRRWQSMRQAIWWSIDPARTRPPRPGCPGPEAWFDYTLAADVMLIRSAEGTGAHPVAPGFPFGRWLAEGHPSGWPTADDLRYHLTTLFPPVRPRGWLELRMLDLLPGRLRDVATIVVLTALTTEAAGELAERLPDTTGLWRAAARHALAHPLLAAGARTLLDVVLPQVDAVTVDSRRRDDVGAFADAYVARAVSPAQLVPDAALLDAPCAPDLHTEAGDALAG